MMGAFISLAFQWRGSLADLLPLYGALESAGLTLVSAGHASEGQCTSTWQVPIAGDDSHRLTCRCYEAGSHVSTTLDIDEEDFDEIAARIGRSRLIGLFTRLGSDLVRVLGLRYVFFEEEAEADLDPETFDGTRLFGITIVPDGAPWLPRVLERSDIARIERLPGTVVIYRRLDPAPHLAE